MGTPLSKKLTLSRPGVYKHWCPGCKGIHFVYTCSQEGKGSAWSYNGDPEHPTFSPSIHIHYIEPNCTDEEAVEVIRLREQGQIVHVPGTRITVCHYFINNGKIQYCSDCPHSLSGQTVDLPDIPDYKETED